MVADVTINAAELLVIPWNSALISVVPVLAVCARPECIPTSLIVATATSELVHDANSVKSCVVLSE